MPTYCFFKVKVALKQLKDSSKRDLSIIVLVNGSDKQCTAHSAVQRSTGDAPLLN